MAHKRGLTPSPQWAKHLRPFSKRKVSKAERQAGKEVVKKETSNE